ncbi:Hypothetical protein A7982_05276 [Minicystis rosea]|nr:Hypothetical protein A7982_05276 [Minicystis rosea]
MHARAPLMRARTVALLQTARRIVGAGMNPGNPSMAWAVPLASVESP